MVTGKSNGENQSQQATKKRASRKLPEKVITRTVSMYSDTIIFATYFMQFILHLYVDTTVWIILKNIYKDICCVIL